MSVKKLVIMKHHPPPKTLMTSHFGIRPLVFFSMITTTGRGEGANNSFPLTRAAPKICVDILPHAIFQLSMSSITDRSISTRKCYATYSLFIVIFIQLSTIILLFSWYCLQRSINTINTHDQFYGKSQSTKVLGT